MAQVIIQGGLIENAFHNQFRFKHETETLAGTKTLNKNSPSLQFLDPGGAARNVDLPAEADSTGLVFVIVNRADAAENIVVRNDAAGTIATIAQNEMGIVACDGVAWQGLVGTNT